MSTSLNSAVQAIKDKIALSASAASAEELAYLGTALDRIGGRATVYEVMEMGDTKKAELLAVATNLLAAAQAESITELTKFVNAVDAKTAALIDSSNQLIASTNTALQTMTGKVATATESLSEAASIAQQQALNGSMFVNHFFASIR